MRGIGSAAKPLRAASLAAVFGVVVAAGVASSAAACTGQYLGGDPRLDKSADVIFTGTAVREMDVGTMSYEWTFVVDGVEKGSVGSRTTVTSYQDSAMCGMRFDLGTRYRVLATSHAQQLAVSSNGGTVPIESLPDPPAVEGVFPYPDWLLPVGLLGFGVMIGSMLWILTARRRPGALSS